jgi:dTDP-4-amino-4,6-dideoxygalactose transaminase
MNIPFSDLALLHEPLRSEIDAAIRRVVESSCFILGPEVTQFEKKFAEYIGVSHAIGVSNGTTALIVALKALHLKPGDEVIVPAMTFYASAEAVSFLGVRPVFVDIDPVTCTLDARKIREKITPRTRVIIPVHLYGQPAGIHEIAAIAQEYNLKILGDCAHAHGAIYHGRRVGAIEDIAAFSFYPSKNLGSIGEAGMVTTNDPRLAELCMMFRNHGSIKKFDHTHVGINARMEALQAAVLAVKLPHLDNWNEQRRSAARFYRTNLANVPVKVPHEIGNTEHVYHVYQIQVENRDILFEKMTHKGIGVNIHYPVPMHLHKGLAYLHYTKGDFPIAEGLASRTLSLPCYPGITDEQLMYVVNTLKELLRV